MRSPEFIGFSVVATIIGLTLMSGLVTIRFEANPQGSGCEAFSIRRTDSSGHAKDDAAAVAADKKCLHRSAVEEGSQEATSLNGAAATATAGDL